MKHIDFENMTTSRRLENGEIETLLLPYDPLPTNYDLFIGNDMHEGNAAESTKHIARFVDAIKAKKNSRVILQGDHLETIAITDKRYDIAVHGHRMARFNAQRDSFAERLEPVADRILWLLDGNHERKICNIYLPNADLAEKWSTVYANGTLVKALFDGWRLASWHGAGMINSRAGDALQRSTNQLVALKRNMRGLPVDDCDIVACGHYHQCLYHAPSSKLALVSEGLELQGEYTEPGRITIDAERGLYRIPEEDRHWMCCGGFLKAYSEDLPSYTEDRGYQATELGYGHIEVKNGKPTKVEVVKME